MSLWSVAEIKINISRLLTLQFIGRLLPLNDQPHFLTNGIPCWFSAKTEKPNERFVTIAEIKDVGNEVETNSNEFCAETKGLLITHQSKITS